MPASILPGTAPYIIPGDFALPEGPPTLALEDRGFAELIAARADECAAAMIYSVTHPSRFNGRTNYPSIGN